MRLSPLKFSLGVSLLVHGLVIGGVVWLGVFHRTAAVVEVGEVITMELIAAPAAAPAVRIETVVATAIPPPPSPPVREIVPAKPVIPLAVEEAISPTPPPIAPILERATEPAPILPAAVAAPATSTATGDNSSPLPGKDFTSKTGNSLTQAEPNALNQAEPEYPLAARRRSQEGTVLVRVTVNVQGEAAAVIVSASSGYELLDQAAMKFARTWKFTPARIGATPVESTVERPVRFKLNR